jgi:hypothetical protein
LDGVSVVQFGKSAVTDKRGCNVLGHSLVMGQVTRTLPGYDGSDLVVGDTALLSQHNVSIDFIGCSELRGP